MPKPKMPNIAAVTFEEIAYAYQVGGLAAAAQIPGSGVGGMGVNLDMGDGEIERIELTDNPLNRMAIAIRDQFPKGMMMPLVLRIMAMNRLAALPEMEPYIRQAEDGSGEQISEAVLRVAARMPLNPNMEFARKQFFRQVKGEFEADPDLPTNAAEGSAP